MIIAFHLTWTTYGHWFPNDPRGSWSDEIWKPQLLRLRPLDEDRRLIQPDEIPRPQLQQFLDSARNTLKHPTVELSTREMGRVADAFTETAKAMELRIFECAVMTNHVHFVVERHPDTYERIVNRLKGRSGQFVREARGLKIASRHDRVPIWTEGYWVRYIDSFEQLEVAIEYVQSNPARVGHAAQQWDFVERV